MDFGIEILSDVQFAANMDEVCQTANNMSNWILRTFYSREKTTMLTL